MSTTRRSFGMAALVVIVASGRVLAVPCGDTTGPANTNVDCSCSDTVTTDTTLTAADPVTTVACSGFIALEVAAGIKLNLGGRTITGAGGDFGVALQNNASLTGKGTVTGFSTTGVPSFSGTSGQTVTSVTSTKNGFGFVFSTNSVLSKNVASSNAIDGIHINNGSGGITLYSNTAKNNGASGISIRLGLNNNIVQKNITTGNVHGISLASNGNNFSGNESYSNSQNGILADGGASGNTFTSNKTESNKVDGIHVEGNNNTLTLNTARVSGDDGIEVIGSGNHLKDNHATQNTNDGLLAIPQGGANADDGKNTGDANGGIQCRIDGALCTP